MERSPVKSLMVLALGALAGLYLINPTAGIFELIPDIVPVVGNLDEAAAVLILTNVLAYYGIDVSRFLGRQHRKNETIAEKPKR